ncbi:MAG TPA: hypothetical protein VJ673_14335 [Aromatoleum sp.]|uniref:hypothetical protein n=1 Tax=Aromatoleum sp. TaxID=2307007 RepID=UPI002B48E7A2|nr:hypothetical protein [Aromatoleum sp.]HJV26863.1 hypothetical protein [Aromatoleum sp.]
MATENHTFESGAVTKQLTTFTDLPFVHRREWNGVDCGSNWHVPPSDNYHEACNVGRQWAELYLQYRRENPAMAGSSSLATITASMHDANSGAERGYAVGFFERLEQEMM